MRKSVDFPHPDGPRRKNFSVNFFFCEVWFIFAMYSARIQDILHNLLKAVWITTSEHNEQNSSSIESKHFQCRLSHIELWLVVSQDCVWRESALFFFYSRVQALMMAILHKTIKTKHNEKIDFFDCNTLYVAGECKSADFRQRLQGSPQTTTQLAEPALIAQTPNMCCYALNFPRWWFWRLLSKLFQMSCARYAQAHCEYIQKPLKAKGNLRFNLISVTLW